MLVRVLEIHPGTRNFHFGKSEAQTFFEVDWFRDDNMEDYSQEQWTKELTTFIKAKTYYDPEKPYLVLHPTKTFTINYTAP
jgi:hypothetical protein